jgi:hypothetical protein
MKINLKKSWLGVWKAYSRIIGELKRKDWLPLLEIWFVRKILTSYVSKKQFVDVFLHWQEQCGQDHTFQF